jgi:hypothetical protein
MISRDERREAEDRIARLIFAYCTRLDAADFEGMASLFEKGTWHIDPETVCRGKDECARVAGGEARRPRRQARDPARRLQPRHRCRR